MKVLQLHDMVQFRCLVRRWGKWYVMLDDGGLVRVKNKWFEEADKKGEPDA